MKYFRRFLLSVFLFLSFARAEQGFDPMLPIMSEKKVEEDIILSKDIYIGSANAPVVIVNYSSFSCRHCYRAYKTIFMKIYDEYIKTGKVVVIMREFPLEVNSMKASIMLRCYAQGLNQEKQNDSLYKIHEIIEKLFEASLDVKDEKELKKNLYQLGFTKSQVSNCLKSQYLTNQVLYSKLFAIKSLGITGTPAIYINGKKYQGKCTLADFKHEIESVMQIKQRQSLG